MKFIVNMDTKKIPSFASFFLFILEPLLRILPSFLKRTTKTYLLEVFV